MKHQLLFDVNSKNQVVVSQTFPVISFSFFSGRVSDLQVTKASFPFVPLPPSCCWLLLKVTKDAGWVFVVWVIVTGPLAGNGFRTKWVLWEWRLQGGNVTVQTSGTCLEWEQLFYCSWGWYFSHPSPRWDHFHLCSVNYEAWAFIDTVCGSGRPDVIWECWGWFNCLTETHPA